MNYPFNIAIMVFNSVPAHSERIIVPFAVRFWHLIGRLDTETVMCDIRQMNKCEVITDKCQMKSMCRFFSLRVSFKLIFIATYSQSINSTCEKQERVTAADSQCDARASLYIGTCVFGSTGVSWFYWKPCRAQRPSIKYAWRLAGIMCCLFDEGRFLCKVEHIEMAVSLLPSHAVIDRCWNAGVLSGMWKAYLGWLCGLMSLTWLLQSGLLMYNAYVSCKCRDIIIKGH